MPRKRMIDPLDRKWVTVSLCSWEVTAIITKSVTGKDTIPTITNVHRKHNWVGAVLTTALAWHFIKEAIK